MNGVTFILLRTPRVCCYALFRGSTIDILTEVPAKWLHFWESYTHRWPEIVPILFVFARWRRKTQEDGGQKEMETTKEQTLDKHRQIRVNTGFVYKPRNYASVTSYRRELCSHGQKAMDCYGLLDSAESRDPRGSWRRYGMRHAGKIHRRGAHPGLCWKVVENGQISGGTSGVAASSSSAWEVFPFETGA